MYTTYYWVLVAVGIILYYSSFVPEEVKDSGSSENTRVKKEKHFKLILGILSERTHFAKRQILRQGLQKQTSKNTSILWKFIVAKQPCMIPLEDRRDIYKCEAQSFLSPSADKFYFHRVFYHEGENEFVPRGPVGYDFIVNDNISVGELGVYDQNNDGFKQHLKVILYETHTQKIILSRTFLPFGKRGSSFFGLHVYKDVTAMILPKGFRGSIVVEGASLQDPLLRTNNCLIDDGGGLITYLPGYRYGNDGVFPAFRENIKSLSYFVGPSFVYSFYTTSLDNATVLSRKRSKRYEDLKYQVDLHKEQLKTEQSKENDLLFVETVESYRNLPQKMLLFYEWVNKKSFDFIMKTDDDCYVNVIRISNFLHKINHQEKVWVGNFRINFLIDLFGKWEEHDYKSLTYPPFACGSGYILSRDIIHWIVSNKYYLKCFQGEDVSLGIWLAAINPVLVNDQRFLCTNDTSHQEEVFSIPDNNLTSLKFFYAVEN